MFKLLRADFRRLLRSKLFYQGTIGYAFIYTALIPLIMFLIEVFTKGEHQYLDSELKDQAGTAGIAIAVFVTLFLNSEFAEGSVRNKLSTGARRAEIFLSSAVVSAFTAMCFQVLGFASIYMCGYIFGKGFMLPFMEILQINVVYLLAAVSVAVFDTMLMYVFKGEQITYFLGTVIAVVMKFASAMVFEKLYPEEGVTALTGKKLEIYTFFDKYCHFAHLTGFPRFDWSAYIISAVVVIAVSIAAGIVVFERVDLK